MSQENLSNLRSGYCIYTRTFFQGPIPTVSDGDDKYVVFETELAAQREIADHAMIRIQEKGAGNYAVTELFKNPDFGSHTQPPVFHNGHFYSHYTVNERSDGLVAMSLDGQVRWKTDQKPAFVRGGSILADGLLLTTDGDTKLYLVDPDPSGFKPIASAVVLEPGDNWAPLALADGTLLIRGQKQLKALQIAR